MRLAPGDPAREPDRVVRGLRAAVADEDLLDRGDVRDDLARERQLGLGDADTEQDGFRHGARYALGDGWMRVPEEDRAVGRVVVDVPPAVEVLQVGAVTAPKADPWVAAAPARVHAAGDDLARGVQQRGRCGSWRPPEESQ